MSVKEAAIVIAGSVVIFVLISVIAYLLISRYRKRSAARKMQEESSNTTSEFYPPDNKPPPKVDSTTVDTEDKEVVDEKEENGRRSSEISLVFSSESFQVAKEVDQPAVVDKAKQKASNVKLSLFPNTGTSQKKVPTPQDALTKASQVRKSLFDRVSMAFKAPEASNMGKWSRLSDAWPFQMSIPNNDAKITDEEAGLAEPPSRDLQVSNVVEPTVEKPKEGHKLSQTFEQPSGNESRWTDETVYSQSQIQSQAPTTSPSKAQDSQRAAAVQISGPLDTRSRPEPAEWLKQKEPSQSLATLPNLKYTPAAGLPSNPRMVKPRPAGPRERTQSTIADLTASQRRAQQEAEIQKLTEDLFRQSGGDIRAIPNTSQAE
jgi:hypothetical protein